jgi:hypothetical protein
VSYNLGILLIKVCTAGNLLWQAGKTLSPRAWYAAFNEQGQLKLDRVLKRIRRGVRMFS